MKVDSETLLNPPAQVLAAIAAEREAGKRRNGHGEYAYRDEWLAGVSALLKLLPNEPIEHEEPTDDR